jgi:hypothetical protein
MGTKVGRRIRKDATLSTEFATRSTEINLLLPSDTPQA